MKKDLMGMLMDASTFALKLMIEAIKKKLAALGQDRTLG
jgi:hypothetical protein